MQYTQNSVQVKKSIVGGDQFSLGNRQKSELRNAGQWAYYSNKCGSCGRSIAMTTSDFNGYVHN